MKQGFSFWNSYIGDSLVRMRSIKGLLLLLMLIFFVIKVKIDFNRAERMCEGSDCVEISVTFAASPDYVQGVDKRKYQWVEIYKKNSDQVLYKRYFDNQNKVTFLIEKGEYYIKTDKQEKEREIVMVDETKELILQ